MATRSLIMRPVQVEGRTAYQANYIHSDGYPGGVGHELEAYYADVEKREQLFALGWLSSLGSEIGEKHDFDWRGKMWRAGLYAEERVDPRNNWCLAYHRDRGEAKRSDFYDSIAEAAAWLGWGYIYVWQNGRWNFFQVRDGVFAPYVEPVEEEEAA